MDKIRGSKNMFRNKQTEKDCTKTKFEMAEKCGKIFGNIKNKQMEAEGTGQNILGISH